MPVRTCRILLYCNNIYLFIFTFVRNSFLNLIIYKEENSSILLV